MSQLHSFLGYCTAGFCPIIAFPVCLSPAPLFLLSLELFRSLLELYEALLCLWFISGSIEFCFWPTDSFSEA